MGPHEWPTESAVANRFTSSETGIVRTESRRLSLFGFGLREPKPLDIQQRMLQPAVKEALGEGGCDTRAIQELPGHRGVSTTMTYTHVLSKGGHGVRSPNDALGGLKEVLW